jgi:predicted nucleic acid-binding protein
LDTSIWLSLLLKDQNYQSAKKVLDDAKKNGDKILYSPLVLFEIIDVIRKKYPKKYAFQGKDIKLQSQIENDIEDRIIKILDILTKWESTGRSVYMTSPRSVVDYHGSTLKILKCCYGDVFPDHYKSEYRYYGPGNADVQHAIIAKECAVNELITMDHGFEKFITIQDFQSISITVV